MTRRCSNAHRTPAARNLLWPLGNLNVSETMINIFTVVLTTILRTKTERRNMRTILNIQRVSHPVACDSTEQSPSWQAMSYWNCQGILLIYGTRIYLTLFTSSFHLFLFWARSIQSTPLSFSLKIWFNIIFPFAPISSKCPLSLRVLYQTPLCTFSLTPMCPAPSILPDLITQTVIGEDYNLWSSSLYTLIKSKCLPRCSIFGHH